MPATQIMAPRWHEYAIVRCLDEPQPEHRARNVIADVAAWLELKGDVFEAELAISELVTNARTHAPAPYELRVYLSTAMAKIAIVDGGADHVKLAGLLAAATVGRLSDSESGRGLQLVTGLFHNRCGAEPATACSGLGAAKQIWIALPR